MYTETKGYDAFEWINCNDNDRSIFSFIRKTGEENYKNAIGFVTNFTPIAREDYRVGVPKAGRTLHPDNMAAGPASYGMTDTLGRMHSDAQFAGSSSVPAHVEMMGLIGMGNNPMVGATVAVAVSVEEAANAGKF